MQPLLKLVMQAVPKNKEASAVFEVYTGLPADPLSLVSYWKVLLASFASLIYLIFCHKFWVTNKKNGLIQPLLKLVMQAQCQKNNKKWLF